MRQGDNASDASIVALEREIESRHRAVEKILGRDELGATAHDLTDAMGIIGSELAYGSSQRMRILPLAVLAAGAALWARAKVSSAHLPASGEQAGFASAFGSVSHAQNVLKRQPLIVAAAGVTLGALVGSVMLSAVALKDADSE